jgi:hypothetical protein
MVEFMNNFTSLLDIDSLRFIFITSTVIALAVYTRFHMSAGGTVFAGYGAILLLTDRWYVFIWILIVSAASLFLVRRTLANYLALPKVWIFFALALTSSLLNGFAVMGVYLLRINSLPINEVIVGSLDSFVLYGAYVTPALLAYDFAKQSLKPTLTAFLLVGTLTVLITLPVILYSNTRAPGISTRFLETTTSIPVDLLWLAATSAILFGAALHLSLKLSSGGFLGAFYLAEIFTVEAFLIVGILSLITYAAVTIIRKNLVLTPRQTSQIAFTLGGLIAWAGLYWGVFFNWRPALEMNGYLMEPLLVVGLIAAEMTRPRSSAVSVLVGTAIATALVALTIVLGINFGLHFALLLIFLIAALLLIPGWLTLKETWKTAQASGQQVKLQNHSSD